MVHLRALVVCTGNTCRSPIAAALLARCLEEHRLSADVASAGTLGWSQRPATGHARTVAAERGLDLGEHVSRRIEPSHLDVDLVIAMTRDHAGAVIARDPSLAVRTFLPAEFVRLAAATAPRGTDEAAPDYVERVGGSRPPGPIGRAADEVSDPAGESLATYRLVADRLDQQLAPLAAALAGLGSGPLTTTPHHREDAKW